MGMDKIIEKRKWPIRRLLKYSMIFLLILLIVYALIVSSGRSTVNVRANQITVSEVRRGIFQDFIPVIGTVMPINTIYLDAVEGGRVETIFVEAGSLVEKGDKILKLSNTNLLMTVLNNEAMVNRAINDLRLTRLQIEQNQLSLENDLNQIELEIEKEGKKLERRRFLYKEQLFPEESYKNFEFYYKYLLKWKELTIESSKRDREFRRLQIKQLEDSVKQMQENLELIKEQLENLTIRAPASGHLTSLNAEIGESKAPGERLGQVDIMDGFKVKAEVDEHFIDRFETGKVGKCNFSGHLFALRVKKIYPEVKEGKFEIDLEFSDSEPEGIKRGQTLHIDLQLSDRSEALLLARGAFFQTTGGSWVFVLDKSDEFAVKRDITFGRQNPGFFEVLAGLQPGEKVITSSYENFAHMERLVIK